MKYLLLFFLAGILQLSNIQAQLSPPDTVVTRMGPLIIQPVKHASLVLSINDVTIYVDPTGADNYKGMPAPNIILVTDIHGDHFDMAAAEALKTATTVFFVPPVVAEKLPTVDKDHLVIIRNGDSRMQSGISIKAIPMYNLPESPSSRHTKGRGNGYVLGLGGTNIYISGDTQGIPEMRSLKEIELAFICMNLPYTMDVMEASDAVLAFKPKIVYPYHYRGQNGLSDIIDFKKLVDAKKLPIDVRLRNWYPGK